MKKKIFFGLAIVLGIVTLAAWEGNGMKKEGENSQKDEEQIILEEIYVVDSETEMVQVEHTTEDADIIYELTEEEERLGLKFVE